MELTSTFWKRKKKLSIFHILLPLSVFSLYFSVLFLMLFTLVSQQQALFTLSSFLICFLFSLLITLSSFFFLQTFFSSSYDSISVSFSSSSSLYFCFHFFSPSPHFSLYFFLISSYRFRSFHLNANFGSIDRNELNKFLWKMSAAKMVAAKMADIEIHWNKNCKNIIQLRLQVDMPKKKSMSAEKYFKCEKIETKHLRQPRITHVTIGMLF